ncbi:hypothetical protein TacPo2_50 [Pantoea bacteriophage TacPo2]
MKQGFYDFYTRMAEEMGEKYTKAETASEAETYQREMKNYYQMAEQYKPKEEATNA